MQINIHFVLKKGHFAIFSNSLKKFPCAKGKQKQKCNKIYTQNSLFQEFVNTHLNWIMTKLMKIDERCHQKYKLQITFHQKTVHQFSIQDPYYLRIYPTKISYSFIKIFGGANNKNKVEIRERQMYFLLAIFAVPFSMRG